MYKKLAAIIFAFFLFSCHGTDKSSNTINTESTTTTNSRDDLEEQKKALNDRSRACIALMNSLEEDMNAASAAGNAEGAAALQLRIDSAATENVKIGQKLMALEK